MKLSATTLLLLAAVGNAEEGSAPRVVAQPLSASIPLPGAASAAHLSTLARASIVQPSTFEVEDALSALPQKTCGSDAPCLAGLARATRSQWALSTEFELRDGRGVLTAHVVDVKGALARPVETLELANTPTSEAGWAAAFTQLLGRIKLESLGAPQQPAEPVAVTPVVKPLVLAPPIAVAPPVSASTVAEGPSGRVTLAVTAGLLAVGAGGAAIALGVTNLSEAAAVRSAMRDGLLPGQVVDRAAALDERTIAATALGIGGGVAAAVAIAALLVPDAPVQLAPSVGPTGATMTLTGRLP